MNYVLGYLGFLLCAVGVCWAFAPAPPRLKLNAGLVQAMLDTAAAAVRVRAYLDDRQLRRKLVWCWTLYVKLRRGVYAMPPALRAKAEAELGHAVAHLRAELRHRRGADASEAVEQEFEQLCAEACIGAAWTGEWAA